MSGEYEIEVTTGAESDKDSSGKVHITLYGKKGKTDQEDLYSTQPDKKVFEPGNIDKFTVRDLNATSKQSSYKTISIDSIYKLFFVCVGCDVQ